MRVLQVRQTLVHFYLGTIHKRRRPIFPILWPPFPLFFVVFLLSKFRHFWHLPHLLRRRRLWIAPSLMHWFQKLNLKNKSIELFVRSRLNFHHFKNQKALCYDKFWKLAESEILTSMTSKVELISGFNGNGNKNFVIRVKPWEKLCLPWCCCQTFKLF